MLLIVGHDTSRVGTVCRPQFYIHTAFILPVKRTKYSFIIRFAYFSLPAFKSY